MPSPCPSAIPEMLGVMLITNIETIQKKPQPKTMLSTCLMDLDGAYWIANTAKRFLKKEMAAPEKITISTLSKKAFP